MTDSGERLAVARPSAVARVLLLLITGYRRFISPMMAPRCRFAPSCSAYALEAVTEHGALRGTWLAVRRVARCHPFHPGGYDPVPPRPGKGPGGSSPRAGTAGLTTPVRGS